MISLWSFCFPFSTGHIENLGKVTYPRDPDRDSRRLQGVLLQIQRGRWNERIMAGSANWRGGRRF